MTDNEKELIRVLELDYQNTTKLIEGVVSSTFTVRGWGMTLGSALIGFTFQTQLWQMAVLSCVVTALIAFIDSYHSWLYSRILLHASNVERVLGLYYAYLARGDDDPAALREFQVALLAHQFGRFTEIERFSLRCLKQARPRLVLVILYSMLLLSALLSGVLVVLQKHRPPDKFECTAFKGASGVFICQSK